MAQGPHEAQIPVRSGVQCQPAGLDMLDKSKKKPPPSPGASIQERYVTMHAVRVRAFRTRGVVHDAVAEFWKIPL